MSVLSFRPFKIPALQETQFFQISDEINQTFLKEDLARSGLVQSDLWATTTAMLPLKEGAQAGYMIPYFDLTGNPITDEKQFLAMFRTRLKYPDFSRESRYSQPSKEYLAKLNLPPYVPYIHPLTLLLEGEELICAEGEKKTVAILKHLQLPAFGIGGCQLWRDPSGNGSFHPWIKQLLDKRGINKVVIVPDGDVRRYDISTAYGNFAHALENAGIQVRILEPPGKIDDLIVLWGDSKNENFHSLPSFLPSDFVQSPAALAGKYKLSFTRDAKERVRVFQNSSNVSILMEQHPGFPNFWRNLDNNKVYMGDKQLDPNRTEVELANFIQYNLGLDKITHMTVRTCIGAIARKNSRSPLLDHIKSQIWDGVKRLDTWLSRIWGAPDDEYHREVSSKWLISACARMDKPGTKIDWIFIVIGPQGTGKTSMPRLFFGENYHPNYGDSSEKDFHMLLHSHLCFGFDELDSFSRREANTLKAMITREEDSFRPPYAAEIETFKRRFTLYGCGNREDFLQNDFSGYRRYAVIKINRKLDFDILTKEKDQLWAEAWHRYQTENVQYWEVKEASSHAEQYVIVSPYEEKIDEFLYRKEVDKIAPGLEKSGKSGFVYFKITELLLYLSLEGEYGNSFRIKEIASILQSKRCIKPTKASRHPDTGAVGKWYIYDPSTRAPL